MSNFASRIRYEIGSAFGRLRVRPGYSIMAAAMLAIAIASNVAVFTVLSRTLLRRFPFNDERLVNVQSTHRDAKGETQEFPAGSVDFVHWKTQSSSFEGMELTRIFAGSITEHGETDAVKVGVVSGGIFKLLGVSPAIGRDFTPADDHPDATAAILSHGLWERRFGRDHGVLGRSIMIDGKPKTILGVMPASFDLPMGRADVYVPVGFSLAHMPEPGGRTYAVFGRTKKGVSIQTAEADLQRISRDLDVRFPVTHKDYGARVKPLREALFGDRRPALITLFVAVLLVHLLACVNVANLMLARISDQRTTTAVRLALGAHPSQIVRYRMTEGLIISLGATAVGLIAGALAVSAILRNYADPDLLASPPGSAWMIAAFAFGLMILTALFVSLLPALRESKVPLAALINEGSQRSSSSIERRRARELFIVVEVALAIPLLIGAAVAVKRFADLRTVDLGFDPSRLLTAQLILPARYDRPARARFAAELVRRLESSPGVASAAITTSNFRPNSGAATVVKSEAMAEYAFVGYRRITPRFFETMSSPLLAGRLFTNDDVADSPPVAIVSEEFAKQFWPGEDPIGKLLVRQNQAAARMTVVGVARDIRDLGVAEEPGPVLYTPYLQNNNIYVSVVIRSAGSPVALRDTLKSAVQSIDSALAPDEVLPFSQLMEESLGSHKLQVALLGGFALIALALAACGIFAVTSYAVAQRMPEIGVRMAFGATPRVVVAELVRAAGMSIAAGVGIGVATTIAAVQTAPRFSSYSAELDPRYAAIVVTILIAAALLASFVPALRARSAKPSELLRGV